MQALSWPLCELFGDDRHAFPSDLDSKYTPVGFSGAESRYRITLFPNAFETHRAMRVERYLLSTQIVCSGERMIADPNSHPSERSGPNPTYFLRMVGMVLISIVQTSF